MSNVLSVQECIKRFQNKTSKFIDGSWHLTKDRDARKEYEQGPRIPNAIFFDIDDVATKDGAQDIGEQPQQQQQQYGLNLPHMMPSKELFGAFMDAVGIRDTDDLIVYGTKGTFSVPRAFYTLRECGHGKKNTTHYNNIHMMDGSLQDWIDAGGEVELGMKSSIRVCDLHTTDSNRDNENMYKYQTSDTTHIKTFPEMLQIVQDGQSGKETSSIIVDARSSARFYGEAPEPRPGIPSGHMPGSKNVPFHLLLDENNMSKFKPKEEMMKVFHDAGINVHSEKEIITTCGSGVTACVIALALEECGRDRDSIKVFDGSWIEWASSEGSPIVTAKED
jgi:thiosulfate/3-mercaptopyruvate sulfurtransferase